MNLELQEHLTSCWQSGLSEWRKEGRKEQIHTWWCAADRPQMMADGGKGGNCKKKRKKKKDCRSISGIDNMVSAPHWGDVTGWQVGSHCLCHWLGDQGWHVEPRLQVLKLITAAEVAVTHELIVAYTIVHTCSRAYILGMCKVTSPIANYCHRASIQSQGTKLQGSTTTRAMCPGVICQTNYLSWTCNCSENR